MSPRETDPPQFTHVGWQYGTPPRIEESDHLALHLDTPPPANGGVPIFQAVDDAVLPSPTQFTEEPAAADGGEALLPILTFGAEEPREGHRPPTVFS